MNFFDLRPTRRQGGKTGAQTAQTQNSDQQTSWQSSKKGGRQGGREGGECDREGSWVQFAEKFMRLDKGKVYWWKSQVTLFL